ncbi:MAG: hypothetical protein HOQ22_07700 [Nocardioidaceae bacterium]|nr:hypothetical protein [Nocardioidaceae bacterium]NUS50909.1 hypothetical protein [Nocardioidaceae bacterium]
MPYRFHRPATEPAVLSAPPEREAFLTAVDEDAERVMTRIAGDVAVELAVGVGRPVSYLLPVVSRLGQRRVPAAFARRAVAHRSTLAVARAEPVVPDDRPDLEVYVVGAAEQAWWKEQVRDATERALAGPPHPGTAALDVSFAVSSLRNWTNLWKPALDAIAGPLLGAPDDDRITRLGLHRTIDDAVGYDVVVRAWWTPD